MTATNYAELKEITDQYQSQGLEVLAFPCNQFGGQEPGSASEIASFVNARAPKVKVMEKIEVNGGDATPIYNWMKDSKKEMLPSNDIAWNFEKFLIGKNGKVVGRYRPTSSPKSIEGDIVKELNA